MGRSFSSGQELVCFPAKGLHKLSAKTSQRYAHDEKGFVQQHVYHVEEAGRNAPATARHWIMLAILHLLLEWLGALQEKRVEVAAKLIRSHQST